MTLVLVHGFMGASAQWDEVIASMPNQGAIAPDLPGFGANNTCAPLSTIQQMAQFVVDFAQEKGVASFDLLGHSMGGMVAQEIAISFPEKVRRLVLYSTGSVGALPGRFETIEQSKARAKVDGVAATADRISATWYRDLEQSSMHAKCAKLARMSSEAAVQAGLDAMATWDRSEELNRIAMPTLILWGEHDRSYSREQVENLERNIPNAHLVEFMECAHAIHDENLKKFSQVISDFLRK